MSRFFIVFASLFLVGVCFAIDGGVAAVSAVVDEPVSKALDLALTAYNFIGAVVVGAILWLIRTLGKLASTRVENETAAGILNRLSASIADAVAMVDQTLRKQLEAARAEASPAGQQITEAEKAQLYRAVWEALEREYGGWDRMFALLRRIGIGDGKAARAKLDTMIEAAVNGRKVNAPVVVVGKKRPADPPKPARD